MHFSSKDFVFQNEGRFVDFYSPGKFLGEGAYGKVMMFTHLKTESVRAVKMLRKAQMSSLERKEFF